MESAAIIAAALLGVVNVFQIALALGVPAAHASWGGRHHGKLPARLRVASAIAGLVVYPLIILVVLETGNVIGPGLVPDVGSIGMWILTGLFIFGALANLASRSRVERVWAPLSLAIAICTALIATTV